MREFIIIGHTASITHRFNLDDLPGSGGRMDALCRCVSSAFLTSHNLRNDVRVLFVLQNTYTIRFEGSELKRVNPDERSTGALFQKALERRHIAEKTGEEFECTPGIYISDRTLDDVLDQVASRGSVVLLSEDGTTLANAQRLDHPIYVLSDHQPFSDDELARIQQTATQNVCVSPRSLHTHQSITIMHHYLDTEGYSNFLPKST